MHDSVISFISHLKNTGSLSYRYILNVYTFLHNIKKNPKFVNVTTDFIRKVFKDQEAINTKL